MTDNSKHIQIEKVKLTEEALNKVLRDAFSRHETTHLQYGDSWLSNLALHALGEHEEPFVYVARLSADNFLALPLKLDLRSRQAHALGNFYTSAYSPLVCTDTPQLLLSALFRHLATREKLRLITLSPMESDSSIFPTVSAALEQAGFSGIHTYFCFGNWVHDLQGDSYTHYLASRPSRLRNTIERKTRKFLDAGRGGLHMVHGGDELETAIRQFVDVYSSSWKKPEPYPAFIPQLLRMSAARGWLRLGIANYDNKPVASQIWLVHHGTAYIFKLAYHSQYKALSVGTVLTAFMMEHVIDRDKVSRIDYLSGDDPYKRDWMSARHEYRGIAAYNTRTLLGTALLAGHRVKKLLKKPGAKRS